MKADTLVAVICPCCKKGTTARGASDTARCDKCGHKWAWKKARLVRAGRK